MPDQPVKIAGAGALGLFVALALVRRGVAVEVWDPGRSSQSASGVAAGMLAAATELVLHGEYRRPDDVRTELLFTAQAHWIGEAVALGLVLDRSGALLPFLDPEEAEPVLHHFKRFEGARLVDGDTSRALQPALGEAVAGAVLVPQDWRIDAMAALAALRTVIEAEGGVFRPQALGFDDFGPEPVVVAAGHQARSFGLLELRAIEPIKGQIVRVLGGPTAGPMIRAQGAYIVPQPGGAMVGATMEEGWDDTRIDDRAIARLLEAADAVVPGLYACKGLPMAGVRASTPDGLPMVGPSSREGVFLATGARRNGWLLAPLVGRMVAAYLTGDDPGPYAARLDPHRFGR